MKYNAFQFILQQVTNVTLGTLNALCHRTLFVLFDFFIRASLKPEYASGAHNVLLKIHDIYD